MAAQKDGRKIFSLSSFLVTLSLGVFCGYLAFTGGFFSSIGDFLVTLYALGMAICGGFALSSCIHWIMVPKSSPQNNQVNGSNGTPQQLTPSLLKDPANASPNPSQLSIPAKQPVESKQSSSNPVASNPATKPQANPTEPQAVKLIGPVAKNNMQFLETFFKLAAIAKDCQELVENEKDLSKKEQVKLSLQRREFRQLYSTVKNSRFDTF